MNIWRELTKKRGGAEGFVASGLGMAVVGAGVWFWAAVVRGDSPPTGAVTFFVVGLVFAGVAAIVARRGKPADDAGSK